MNQQKADSLPFELSEVPKSEVGALALLTLDPKTYVAEVFKPYRAKLVALVAASDGIVDLDITTTAGMAVAVAQRAGFRDDVRLAAKKTHQVRKAPILEIGRLLDSELKTITTDVTPYETKWDALIDAEVQRKAEIKAEADRIERERVLAIRAKIDEILSTPRRCAGFTALQLTEVLEKMAAMELTAAEFAELLPDATVALDSTATMLLDLRNQAIVREKAEADRLDAIEAEKQRIAAAAEANRLEAERLAALQRERDLAEQERQRVAAAALAEQQRVAAESKRQLEAQAAAIEAARKQVEADAAAAVQRQADERAAFEQEKVAFAKQQADAEAARKAAEAPPVTIHAESVRQSLEAEEAQPESVCDLLVQIADAAPPAPEELAGESSIDAVEAEHLTALRTALWSMLETKTVDEVRALVDVELAAFGGMAA